MGPAQILERTFDWLDHGPLRVIATSPIIASCPVGPSLRRYANAAVVVETTLPPHALLAYLKGMERAAGRRPGQRWGARPLDLDIILWSGGRVHSRALTIPHAMYRERDFVLWPLAHLAPNWRDPVTMLTVRHQLVRIKRAKPVDPAAAPL